MAKNLEAGAKRLPAIPLISLVVANTVPVVGVVWFGWDVLVIVALYWSENLIAGFFTALKLAFAPAERLNVVKKLIVIPVFLWFWGWFVAGHGVVILFLFVIFPDIIGLDSTLVQRGPSDDLMKVPWPGPLFLFQLGIEAARFLCYVIPSTAIVVFCFMAFSHGISFVHDYLPKGARYSADLWQPVGETAIRIVILHLAIMVGGFLIMLLSPNLVVLVCLVLLKCWLDASLYLRQHRKRMGNAFAGDVLLD